MSTATIESAVEADAGDLANIYNYYIRNSVATFEEENVSAADLCTRLSDVAATGYPWLVMREEGRILGYAYANRWNPRAAYRHTAEVTIYLSHDCTSRRIGSRLYEALFARLRDMPVHVVIGGITLPNPASVAIHEKFGMRKVAHFEAVGYKFGQWLDVGYWQVVLQEQAETGDVGGG